jgi:hypothetical protein
MCDSNNCPNPPFSAYRYDEPLDTPEKIAISYNVYSRITVLDPQSLLYFSKTFAHNYAFPVPHPNPSEIDRECWTKHIAYGIMSYLKPKDTSTDCMHHIFTDDAERERITQTVWFEAESIMNYLSPPTN